MALVEENWSTKIKKTRIMTTSQHGLMSYSQTSVVLGICHTIGATELPHPHPPPIKNIACITVHV